MKKVSILIPCYNEELNLPKMYVALCSGDGAVCSDAEYDWEIMLVNDGSRDNTQNIIEELAAKDPRIHYVCLSRNFGKEAAMLAGFDAVTGDCMVVMDADFQDPPVLILQMLKEWKAGYEDVYAKRRTRGKESWLRRNLSLAFYALLQKSARFDVLENVGDYRLLDRKCIDVLCQLRESNRYTKGMFAWIGFKKKELLFDRGDREDGVSSWNFFSLFFLAVDGITSFTTAPLRLSTIFGILVSFISFIYMCVVVVKAMVWGDPVSGYPSLMAIILFLGGVQLLSLGIIGEYLARIFCESKHRPIYVVSKKG